MAAHPITLTGDDVGEAMRAVHMVLNSLTTEERIRDEVKGATNHEAAMQTLRERIARLRRLDVRLSKATDGENPDAQQNL